jgi:transmembrane sensor
MDNKEAKELLEKYFAGTCTAEEELLVEQAYNLESLKHNDAVSEAHYTKMKQELWSRLDQGHLTTRKKIRIWPKIVAAASICMAVSAVIYFYSNRGAAGLNQAPQVVLHNDVAPGRNTATLVLADGKTINLSDDKKGVVLNTARLAYDDGTEIASAQFSKQMTLSTPRGGQYQMTLPDGTRVWLNAASSLTYIAPLNVHGGERLVKLIGEAYFEVAKLKSPQTGGRVPFVVESKGQKITVLGTHFNVNAYADESALRTTLLEGSVEVSLTGIQKTARLVPGQQAVFTGNQDLNVKQVDGKDVLAWKDGDFVFKDDNLQSALKKVARWYDVEIIYGPDAPKDLELIGWVSRNKELSVVLKMIASTKKVHFNVTGRRVLVTK